MSRVSSIQRTIALLLMRLIIFVPTFYPFLQSSVTLTDGRVYSCKVMGTDEIVDIAVLKIIPEAGPSLAKLPVAKLGDSDQLSVGKIVIAVGSPGGLDNTVTCGIISGLERSSTMVGIPHKKVDYIQVREITTESTMKIQARTYLNVLDSIV
jgi:Trypsin-like peptidase domain